MGVGYAPSPPRRRGRLPASRSPVLIENDDPPPRRRARLARVVPDGSLAPREDAVPKLG
jgi:hypothetical protein